MTNQRPGVGVGVLIYNSHGQLLLGKRVSSHDSGTWSPVGGHLEYGETLEACAAREAFEEAGLIIENLQFLAITNDIFEGEKKHYISIFMKAYVPDSAVPEAKEPHKTRQWQWFNTDQLPQPLFLSLQKFLNGETYTPAHSPFEKAIELAP